MSDLEDLRAACRRLAWVHADKALAIAKALERDPDAPLQVDGLACVAAWNEFCKATNEYRRAKEAKVDEE